MHSGAATGGVLRIHLSGEIDFEACEELGGPFLRTVRGCDAERVVVDLGATTFIDSHCVAMFLAGYDAAHRGGRGFALVNAHGLVQRVLDVAGVAALFPRDAR